MNSKKLDLATIRQLLSDALQKVNRYSLVLFLLFVGGLYGFIILEIGSLSNAQPSSQDISQQVNAAQLPRIDKTVVKQLKSLQDNSVNVQSLFNDARNNPFQE
jgi:hypothetical protein